MAMKELHLSHRHSVACGSSFEALLLWPVTLFINSSPSFATCRIINEAYNFRTVCCDSRNTSLAPLSLSLSLSV
jgi:hypothetical protein